MKDTEEKESIFRKEALSKLSSIEDLDKMLYVVKPKDWLGLIVGIIILLGFVFWAIFGSVTTITGGNGIFMDFAKVKTIVAPTSGEVIDIIEHVGSKVKKNDVLAVIMESSTKKIVKIKSPDNGLITNIYVGRGNTINRNQMFFEIQKFSMLNQTKEKFYCFVPIKGGDKIKPGMKVKIFPWSLENGDKKAIIGVVEKLSYLPASQAYFNRIFLNESYYSYLTKNEPVIPVIVKPLYKESKIEEPLAEEIPLGSFVTIEVILKKRKPITYLLPFLYSKENEL